MRTHLSRSSSLDGMSLTFDALRERSVLGLVCLDKWVRFSALHMTMSQRDLHTLTQGPDTQGQVERVNQVLEDMLRACVISFDKKWEESLPFAEFSYNNSYQASLKMAPFEVLYGRKC